ncbi:MAG TPA: ABC transporter substrate-binding protein [Stellaceae bacterium]|nr:ABC transporter substrate-binding protein [Stellaceae bacterium]
MTKPALVALLAAVAAIVGAARAGGASAQEMTRLAVSYSTTADFTPAFIAKDAGIFAKHGLDVTLENLATTSLGPPALQAGSLQIASTSPPLLLLANDGGMDLVAVAGVAALDAKAPNSALVTRPGFIAKTAQDFIGKRIARPGINSAIDILLKKWLLDRHVALDQVTFAETPFPQMGDLLRAGRIDAAVELEPLLTRVVASGAGIKSIDFISEVNPHIVASIYGASREWATAHVAAVHEFRAALGDAMRFAHDNPDRATEIQHKYLGAAGRLPGPSQAVTPADFDFWIATLNQLKMLQQPATPATLVFP